jgi:trans-aconitate methyltransferase
MKLNGFDSIAGIYDVLAKLVFGQSIQRAQTHFLPNARNCTSILVLGGGTGWLLRHIRQVNAAAHIVYVDASSAMLHRARRQGSGCGHRDPGMPNEQNRHAPLFHSKAVAPDSSLPPTGKKSSP